ncbi:hypothetical protein ACFU76_04595 [Streptomyces sp. NPDC057539]|uniref:hypothetical protein n=1 Tax=Streptomyces sp. NPDC057539 TaxID=3346159 RepID=UPI0036A8479B
MTTWQPTRGDLKKFLKDVADNPGKTYYSIREAAQSWGSENVYREIVFTPSRLWVGKWGHHGAEGVLSLYGPISDVAPTTKQARPLFEAGGAQYPPDLRPTAPASKRRRLLASR